LRGPEPALWAFRRYGDGTTHQIPTSEPAEVIAGDTWQWTAQFPDYPASEGGACTYGFTGPASFTLSGSQIVVSGDAYAVTVAAAVTAALTPGIYQWAAYITTGGTVRHTARAGSMRVAPNVATLTGANQSHAAKMLALLEAELEARVTGAAVAGGMGSIESYQVAGRSVNKIPTPELRSLLGKYRWQVWCEQNPGQMGPQVGVSFGHAR
jgi:hypothetical protein